MSERMTATMTGDSPYLLKKDRFSSHAQITSQLRQVARSQPQPFTVLDVGCAAGFLNEFLPTPDFRFVGVERDPDLVAIARQRYDTVFQADLSQPLDLPLEPPQAIILADILEHLPDPETVLLDLLQRYAKPGTPVIISLPNVAHLYVRLSLLLGKFDYSDRGILDRTHLRFFTLKTARQLCETCGLRIQSVTATPVPLPLVNPAFGEGQPLFPVHQLSAGLASTFKGLLAFQFIFRGVYEP